MPTILYNEKEYKLENSETVLECLLRHNIDYPHSCKSGTCQSCLSHLKFGKMIPDWQKGLKSTFVAQNYFLPCISTSQEDLTIELPNQNSTSAKCIISEIFYLNHNILCLRLKTNEPIRLSVKPGQYLNLSINQTTIRSYSIANLPYKDGYFEFHIKLVPNGLMSEWLIKNAKVGSTVFVRGPVGNCFYYNPKNISFSIVMIGTGTGLAPLFGIALDAIQQNHQGDIYLIHGGVTKNDLYLNKELEELSQKHPHFYYLKSTLDKEDMHDPIELLLIKTLKGIEKNSQVFICGPEETVKKLKFKAFLAGVSSASIYCDPFVTAK